LPFLFVSPKSIILQANDSSRESAIESGKQKIEIKKAIQTHLDKEIALKSIAVTRLKFGSDSLFQITKWRLPLYKPDPLLSLSLSTAKLKQIIQIHFL
jgi:hypothetical protein